MHRPLNLGLLGFCAMNLIDPKKMFLSTWTAVEPLEKQKHFLVNKVMLPEAPDGTIEWIEWIEIEAAYTQATAQLHWRELRDQAKWHRGWA